MINKGAKSISNLLRRMNLVFEMFYYVPNLLSNDLIRRLIEQVPS